MAPVITSISPTQSHHAVPMTITGTGLSSVIKVNFGTRQVTPTSVTSTIVTCMIPELPASQYNVSVFTGSLTSNSLPFYYIGPPKVTSLAPSTGPLAATPLSVFGENLATTTSVAFGDAGVASDVVITSNTRLTVMSPEHAPLEPGTCTDTVDVVVTTAGGTSFSTGAGSQYTYYDAPAVTGMRPFVGLSRLNFHDLRFLLAGRHQGGLHSNRRRSIGPSRLRCPLSRADQRHRPAPPFSEHLQRQGHHSRWSKPHHPRGGIHSLIG